MLCLEEVKSFKPTRSQSRRVASQIQLSHCDSLVATSKLQANSIHIAVIYSIYLVIYLIIYLSGNLIGKPLISDSEKKQISKDFKNIS